MAIDLERLSKAFESAEFPEFKQRPIYEQKSDTLLLYTRDVPSFERRISRDLTVFLAFEDKSFVGVALKGFKKVLCPKLKQMGIISVGEHESTTTTGRRWKLRVFGMMSWALDPDAKPISPEWWGDMQDALDEEIDEELCCTA